MADDHEPSTRRHLVRHATEWIAALAGIGASIALAGILVSRIGGGRVTWTAAPSPQAIALPAHAVFADSTAEFAAVDSYVVREMRGVRVPGFALSIVRGDRVVHQRGFGAADARGTPVTPETPFILGSLTKSFTALAVMQQVEAGRIALDSSVQRYLPWFHVRDRAASSAITIRHLLNHTSGLPKSAGLQLVRGAEAETRAEQARLLRRVTLHHRPGTAFEYSNANYWLLGLVLETVSGESYADYVRRHILEPLGMRRTFTSESAARAYGLAQGHRVWFGFPRAEELPYYARELAVGYLISTTADMSRYLSAQLGASGPGTAVISPPVLAALHTPPPGSPYAMGWLTDSIGDTPVLWHTGSVANYHGDMLLIPARSDDPGIGVVILANVNNFMLETQLGETTKGVGALLLGIQPATPKFWRFRETYWAIVALACLWLGWRLYQVATLGPHYAGRTLSAGTARGQRALLIATVADPGVSLGLLVAVPVALASPLSTLRWFVPDLTDWLILNAILSVVIGLARIVVSSSGRRPIYRSTSD